MTDVSAYKADGCSTRASTVADYQPNMPEIPSPFPSARSEASARSHASSTAGSAAGSVVSAGTLVRLDGDVGLLVDDVVGELIGALKSDSECSEDEDEVRLRKRSEDLLELQNENGVMAAESLTSDIRADDDQALLQLFEHEMTSGLAAGHDLEAALVGEVERLQGELATEELTLLAKIVAEEEELRSMDRPYTEYVRAEEERALVGQEAQLHAQIAADEAEVRAEIATCESQ